MLAEGSKRWPAASNGRRLAAAGSGACWTVYALVAVATIWIATSRIAVGLRLGMGELVASAGLRSRGGRGRGGAARRVCRRQRADADRTGADRPCRRPGGTCGAPGVARLSHRRRCGLCAAPDGCLDAVASLDAVAGGPLAAGCRPCIAVRGNRRETSARTGCNAAGGRRWRAVGCARMSSGWSGPRMRSPCPRRSTGSPTSVPSTRPLI